MKKVFIITSIGAISILSADCPNGNCGYPQYNQGQGYYYQGQNPGYNQQYYQGQNPGYNQQYYQGQNPGYNQQYYQGQNPGYNPQYYQGQPQRNNQQYVQDQSQRRDNSQYQDQSQRNDQQYYQKQQGSARQEREGTAKVANDDDIAKNVHSVISSGWFSTGYQDVSFDVTNGNVTIKGFVDSADDKKKVEDSIKKIDGVKKVDNQLNVRTEKAALNYYQPSYTADNGTKVKMAEKKFPQDFAATDNDRVINGKIRDKLNGGWFTKGFETLIIRTSNGIVTITGTVEKFDDIQKVNDEVKKLDGVKSVNNQLTVKK